MTSQLSLPSLPTLHRGIASQLARLLATPCVLIGGLLMPLPASLGAAPMPLKEISAAELAEWGQVFPVTNGRAKVDGDTVEHIELSMGRVKVRFRNKTAREQDVSCPIMVINRYGMRLATATVVGSPARKLAPGAVQEVEGKFNVPSLAAIFRPAGLDLPADWRLFRFVVIYDVEREQARDNEERARGMRAVRANSYDKAPVPRSQSRPVWPRGAAGTNAEVVVGFTITEKGDVIDVTVVRSTDRDFNAAAVTCVSQWKFTPALKDGQPVASKLQVPIVFQRR